MKSNVYVPLSWSKIAPRTPILEVRFGDNSFLCICVLRSEEIYLKKGRFKNFRKTIPNKIISPGIELSYRSMAEAITWISENTYDLWTLFVDYNIGCTAIVCNYYFKSEVDAMYFVLRWK